MHRKASVLVSLTLLIFALTLFPAVVRAAVVASFDAGILTVTGDDNGNAVTIAVNGSEQVTVNGATVDDGGSPVMSTEVTGLTINLGGGADVLTVDLPVMEEEAVTVDAGAGNDKVTLTLSATADPTVELGPNNDELTITGGDIGDHQGNSGADEVTFKGTDLGDFGWITAQQVTLNSQQQLAGIEKITINVGKGNDDFNVYNLPANRDLIFLGKGGDDQLGLGIGSGSGTQVLGDVFFNGAGGFDQAGTDTSAVATRGEWTLQQASDDEIRFRGNEIDLRLNKVDKLDTFFGVGVDTFNMINAVAFPDPPVGGGDDIPLVINSHAGNDRIDVELLKDRALLDLGEGKDVGLGGAKADSLDGDPGNDVLKGRGGADLLDGNEGDDECYGQAGVDGFVSCETKVQ